MKASTKAKLEQAESYCDENDKSTEFMIQYMQDYASVSFDCVMSYLGRHEYRRIAGRSPKRIAKESGA